MPKLCHLIPLSLCIFLVAGCQSGPGSSEPPALLTKLLRENPLPDSVALSIAVRNSHVTAEAGETIALPVRLVNRGEDTLSITHGFFNRELHQDEQAISREGQIVPLDEQVISEQDIGIDEVLPPLRDSTVQLWDPGAQAGRIDTVQVISPNASGEYWVTVFTRVLIVPEGLRLDEPHAWSEQAHERYLQTHYVASEPIRLSAQ